MHTPHTKLHPPCCSQPIWCAPCGVLQESGHKGSLWLRAACPRVSCAGMGWAFVTLHATRHRAVSLWSLGTKPPLKVGRPAVEVIRGPFSKPSSDTHTGRSLAILWPGNRIKRLPLFSDACREGLPDPGAGNGTERFPYVDLAGIVYDLLEPSSPADWQPNLEVLLTFVQRALQLGERLTRKRAHVQHGCSAQPAHRAESGRGWKRRRVCAGSEFNLRH